MRQFLVEIIAGLSAFKGLRFNVIWAAVAVHIGLVLTTAAIWLAVAGLLPDALVEQILDYSLAMVVTLGLAGAFIPNIRRKNHAKENHSGDGRRDCRPCHSGCDCRLERPDRLAGPRQKRPAGGGGDEGGNHRTTGSGDNGAGAKIKRKPKAEGDGK